MKSFRSYLLETPLNQDNLLDSVRLEIEAKAKTPQDVALIFEKEYLSHFKKLGEGAQRTAYLVPVSEFMFDDDLTKLLTAGTASKSGSLETVVKVARHYGDQVEDTLRANFIEWHLWNKIKGHSDSRWFVPIIDSSEIIFPNAPKGKGELPFIQTAVCSTDHNTIMSHMTKTFGPFHKLFNDKFISKGPREKGICASIFLNDFFTMGIYNLGDLYSSKEFFDFASDYFTGLEMADKDDILNYPQHLTEKQEQNIIDFFNIYKKYELSDIHVGNVGVYDNRLVMLDYVFV